MSKSTFETTSRLPLRLTNWPSVRCNADVSKSPTRRLDVSIFASNMDTYLGYVQIVDTLPGAQLIQSHVQIKILLAHLLVPEHPHIL